MRVDKVAVHIRYSRPMRDGSYKTVELAAEGSLTSLDEEWQELQADLYRQLGHQMKYVFSGNGSGKAGTGPEKAIETVPPPPLPLALPRENYCQAHQCQYKRYEKAGRVWWSHRVQDGSWCKE